MRQPSDATIGSRSIAAYLVILIGYFLYCYNFNVVDYVRPYLVSNYRFSIVETTNLSIAQNIGVTIGAFSWAALVVRFGHRAAAVAIMIGMGLVASLIALSTGFAEWLVLRGLLAGTLGGFYVVTTAVVVAIFPTHLRGRLIAVTAATYPVSNIVLGALGASLGDSRWHWLLWIATASLVLAPFAFIIPKSTESHAPAPDELEVTSGGWLEMISARWRWRTLGCICLSGIDFIAYGLAAAFMTLYLREVRAVDAVGVGLMVSLLSMGSLVGTFTWAWVSDRFGRRKAALGYVIAAAALLVLLFTGLTMTALIALFGFGLACNSAWGAWFAELFPDHLRPYGAALFHGGHIVAMLGPLFVNLFTPRYGLVPTMVAAAPVYLIGALVWFLLPETLRREEAGIEPTGEAQIGSSARIC